MSVEQAVVYSTLFKSSYNGEWLYLPVFQPVSGPDFSLLRKRFEEMVSLPKNIKTAFLAKRKGWVGGGGVSKTTVLGL